ncbi:MAG TPA: hypothetical protein VFU05_06315 [Cyclobacteriaceae bacterium]|nr:hypothetical protein [Cyclobacteriaceae bacterium]
MKRLLFFILLLPFLTSAQSDSAKAIVKVYIYTDATPTAVSVTPADMKYNKTSVFMLSLDDDNAEGWSVFKNAQKYHFTDGAGKEFTFPIEYALNGMNSYNNNELIDNGYNSMSWAELTEVMKHRCTYSNHGFYHFPCSVKNQPGWENAGCLEYLDNIIVGERYFYRKFGEKGIPLSSRIWTNPSDDTGYYKHLDSLGYMATSSQGSTDNGYIVAGGPNDIQAGSPITIPTINAGFKLYRRDFSDAWENDYNGRIKGYLNTLLTTSTIANRKMYRIGSHLNANAILYIDSAFQFIQNNANDNCWVTTTQEFEEYFEIKRIVEPTKTVTTNGNLTVVTYDFSDVPDKNRFRDMSLGINVTGANFVSAFVTGVDDYSYNTQTGVLNFYSEKRNGYSRPYGSDRVTGQVPLTPDMLVVSGYPITEKEDTWLDGSATNFSIGSGTYATDTVDVHIEFDPFNKRDVKITQFQFWDANGDALNNPAVFYGVKKYTGEAVQLATFDGSNYNAWTNVDVTDTSTWKEVYMRKTHVNDNAYSRVVPGKIKIIGSYNDDSIYHAAFIPNYTKSKFKKMAGANTYWSQIGSPEADMKQKSVLFDNAVKLGRERFYFDLCQHFYPGDSTWFKYYDSVFKWVHDANVDINVAVKSMPEYWVTANYPQTINGNQIYDFSSSCLNNVVPAPWGSDWSDANNYLDISKYLFQIAARYGSNPYVPTSLINRQHQPEFAYQDKDVLTAGLGYVGVISVGNENDKSWIGDNKWLNQSGDELMAQASACYDGNEMTMGNNAGIKTADPEITVLPAAYTTAGARDDIMRMGRRWVIDHRGYRADGVTPDWPFDEFDFHNYSSDAGGQHQQTKGKSHEQSVAYGEVDTVLAFSGSYMNSMKLNITETGWDTKDTTIGGVRQGTIQNAALDIPGKDVYQVQADWTSRMALLSWGRGISNIDFYELYDNSDVNAYLTLYSSTGLFWSQNQGYWSGVYGAPKNKPSGNFLVQMRNLLDNYVVDSITVNPVDSVWTIKATYNDTTKYVVWVGTEKGATSSVTLPVDTGTVYDLNYSSEVPSNTTFSGSGGYTLTATEKPVIVLAGVQEAGVTPPVPNFRFRFRRGAKIKLKQVY